MLNFNLAIEMKGKYIFLFQNAEKKNPIKYKKLSLNLKKLSNYQLISLTNCQYFYNFNEKFTTYALLVIKR